jgi:FAD/FMN-containing dehydrogenase
MNLSLNSQTQEIRNEYCKKLIDIILKYDGKTYLAKHPYFSKNDFQKMYPNYKKMLELKNKYDPNYLFCSDATDRLFVN